MENIEFHVIPPPRGSAGNNKARESVIKKNRVADPDELDPDPTGQKKAGSEHQEKLDTE